MIDVKRIQSLPQIPSPVLTAYLSTSPGSPSNQGRSTGYVIYLKSRAKVLARRLSQTERKSFEKQVKRVENHVRNRRPGARGLVLFAGDGAWEEFHLQVEVEDELHWGRPSLTQLLWLLDEHQACGVAHVDRKGVRLLRLWLGEMEEVEHEKFEVDTTAWRRKDAPKPARASSPARGTLRDAFEQRVEAQYARLYRETAQRIEQWAQREKFAAVFVTGPNTVAEPVWNELSESFRALAGFIKSDLARFTTAALQQQIAPQIEKWKRQREKSLVAEVLGMARADGGGAAAGIDKTLDALQRGRTRELVVVRGLGGKLRQCTGCGWVSRSADANCPACGAARDVAPLRAVLPELARRWGVPVEVVAGEAAQMLRQAGGLAARFR
ncbi:MAG: VLRF1 family aeRF1-type release factor [Candidatus Acidiferrales bacterium]